MTPGRHRTARLTYIAIAFLLGATGIVACLPVAAGGEYPFSPSNSRIVDEVPHVVDTTDASDADASNTTADSDTPDSPRVQPNMPVPEPHVGVIHHSHDPIDPDNDSGGDSASDNTDPTGAPPVGIVGHLGNG